MSTAATVCPWCGTLTTSAGCPNYKSHGVPVSRDTPRPLCECRREGATPCLACPPTVDTPRHPNGVCNASDCERCKVVVSPTPRPTCACEGAVTDPNCVHAPERCYDRTKFPTAPRERETPKGAIDFGWVGPSWASPAPTVEEAREAVKASLKSLQCHLVNLRNGYTTAIQNDDGTPRCDAVDALCLAVRQQEAAQHAELIAKVREEERAKAYATLAEWERRVVASEKCVAEYAPLIAKVREWQEAGKAVNAHEFGHAYALGGDPSGETLVGNYDKATDALHDFPLPPSDPKEGK